MGDGKKKDEVGEVFVGGNVNGLLCIGLVFQQLDAFQGTNPGCSFVGGSLLRTLTARFMSRIINKVG